MTEYDRLQDQCKRFFNFHPDSEFKSIREMAFAFKRGRDTRAFMVAASTLFDTLADYADDHREEE